MTEIIREGYKFRQEILIPCYQTGSDKRLRPSAFMDQAQEIAFWAAQGLGFGYDQLHIHHTAWVLSRMHIRFLELPLWRDRVSIQTWHKGIGGIFFLRDFKMMTPEGKTLINATSSWVIIDEQSRRFRRPEDVSEILRDNGFPEHAIEEPAPKLAMPKGLDPEPAGEHVISYSDIDFLGHSNNVRYVVWAMDCIPLEAAQRQIKDLNINFIRETRPGDTVQLFRLEDGDSWYVEGRTGDNSCFIVKMDF